jgi:hypothetical protein
MKNADLALHEARRPGKNNYRIAAFADLLALRSGDVPSPSGLSPETNLSTG